MRNKGVICVSNLVMVTVANGLSSEGVEVHLVAVNAVGVNLGGLHKQVILHDLKSQKAVYSLWKLQEVIQSIEPDAVLACANMPSFLVCILKLFRRIKCRVVISERAVFSITMANAPILVRVAFPLFVRLFYRYADQIISVSDDVAKDLADNFSIPNKKIKTIYNPIIDDNISDSQWKPKAFCGQNYIVAVGRLNPQKNYLSLLRAYASLNEDHQCRLVILGSGSEKTKIQSAINELRLQHRVLLLGYRPRPEIWMKRALVYVSASNWEGLPGATIQAINVGMPVVVTNCKGGISDVTENGELAYLVRVGDEKELAAKLEQAIERAASGKYFPDEAKLKNWRKKFSIKSRVQDYYFALLPN